MRSILLFLHLVGVAIWVGGMFFAHHVLRPAAGKLEAPQRLALMHDALARFFRFVAGAIALIWLSGIGRFAQLQGASAPVQWHLMAALGAAMTVIYLWIRFVPYRALGAALGACEPATAAAALGTIRRWVGINLILGFATIAVATQS